MQVHSLKSLSSLMGLQAQLEILMLNGLKFLMHHLISRKKGQ